MIRKAHLRGWRNVRGFRSKKYKSLGQLEIHRDGSRIFTTSDGGGWTLQIPGGTKFGQFAFSHQARQAHADLRLMSK